MATRPKGDIVLSLREMVCHKIGGRAFSDPKGKLVICLQFLKHDIKMPCLEYILLCVPTLTLIILTTLPKTTAISVFSE